MTIIVDYNINSTLDYDYNINSIVLEDKLNFNARPAVSTFEVTVIANNYCPETNFKISSYFHNKCD